MISRTETCTQNAKRILLDSGYRSSTRIITRMKLRTNNQCTLFRSRKLPHKLRMHFSWFIRWKWFFSFIFKIILCFLWLMFHFESKSESPIVFHWEIRFKVQCSRCKTFIEWNEFCSVFVFFFLVNYLQSGSRLCSKFSVKKAFYSVRFIQKIIST